MHLDGGMETADLLDKRLEFSLAEILEIVKDAHVDARNEAFKNISQTDGEIRAFVDTGHIKSYLEMSKNIGARFKQIYDTKA